MPLQAGMAQGFVQMAFQSQMLPVLLYGKHKDPPMMLITVAAALEGLVMIGYRGNPGKDEVSEPIILKGPSCIGLPTQHKPNT